MYNYSLYSYVIVQYIDAYERETGIIILDTQTDKVYLASEFPVWVQKFKMYYASDLTPYVFLLVPLCFSVMFTTTLLHND